MNSRERRQLAAEIHNRERDKRAAERMDRYSTNTGVIGVVGRRYSRLFAAVTIVAMLAVQEVQVGRPNRPSKYGRTR